MINKEDVLSMELSIDTILVKKAHVKQTNTGLILTDINIQSSDYRNFDYEIVKVHPECFKKGEFTKDCPQKGDTVIVDKYDARKIFEDTEEYEKDNKIYKDFYYLIKDTNVQAYIRKGE